MEETAMKKQVIIFLISLIFGFCLAKVGHAETYYRISQTDYSKIYRTLCAYECGDCITILETIHNYPETESSFSKDVDPEIVQAVVDDYVSVCKRTDVEAFINGRLPHLKALLRELRTTKQEMSTDEKLSLIRGEISLLEMRIIKLEGGK